MAARIWAQQVQIIPKMKIFAIFISFNHNFFFKLNMMIACDNVKLSKQCKTLKQAKIKFKIRFFTIISRLVHNFLKKKAQNESLELCLTTSGDKTYEKNLGRGQNQAQINFLYIFSQVSNIISPSYYTRLQLGTMSSSTVELFLSLKKSDINQALTSPNLEQNKVFQHFLSNFIKRGKILLN